MEAIFYWFRQQKDFANFSSIDEQASPSKRSIKSASLSGKYQSKGVLLILLVFFSQTLLAQCSSCIGAAACSGGSGAVTNGTNINSGSTYYYSSTGSLGGGINLNGGTLRICGNLTLSGINFNSGNLVVEAGGSLTINGGSTLYLNGNSRIYNRGTLTINRNVAMQNSNNLINNCLSSSVLNMNGGSHTLELNSSSSFFTNHGTANIHTLFLQSNVANNAVCLGLGSSLELTNLNNNKANGINAPSGKACIRYTSNAALNSNLSNSSDVVICRGSGATTSGGAGFGSATVNVNCTSCLTALPITLIDYTINCKGIETIIEWTAAHEDGHESFTVEKSYDGIYWQSIKEINDHIANNGIKSYQVVCESENTNVFYRLKQTDKDGQIFHFEPIMNSQCKNEQNSFTLYPNPANQKLHIVYAKNLNEYKIVLYNSVQEIVFESDEKLESIDLANLISGIYFLKINEQVSMLAVEH